MPDSMLDLIIARYLRGGVSPRGALHETVPAKPPATKTPVTAKPLPATLGVSFVPLMNKMGAVSTQRVSPQTIAWAQNITEVLGGIDPADQTDMLTRYGHVHSVTLAPRGIIPGFFYTFRYEAKTTDQYDRFPLMLALQRDTKGVFGMNFHYLPIKLRFALFESMMPLIIPLPVRQLSLIRLTYKKLMLRRMIGKLPTLKRYSFSQFRSDAVFISPLEWAVALAYPSDKFIGTNNTRVWDDAWENL